ncbi:MAG: hypothetical protein K2W95_33170 [Candidatus Obscuribacterales bacterium]|nr:hypothetical protein [Candidatus Obscuribacterales bacterium]
MSTEDSSDRGIPVGDGQADVRGVRGALNSQIADLLTNPQEHKVPWTSANAIERINQTNQLLPYIDMTQAFMANPDPNYKKVQTYKGEAPEDGAAPGTAPGRRRTPAPQTRRT